MATAAGCRIVRIPASLHDLELGTVSFLALPIRARLLRMLRTDDGVVSTDDRRTERHTMQPIKTILVPTDFSAPAERALAYAKSLADASGATLHLLSVIEDPFAGGVHMGMVGALPEGYFEHLDQQSRARLGTLLTDDEKAKYSAVIATRMGYPATEILEYVRDHGAIDLIVMATAGHGAIARLMIGSVTDKIVRTAPCPVLTVHPHDRPVPAAHAA